jgi:hypothetical protein
MRFGTNKSVPIAYVNTPHDLQISSLELLVVCCNMLLLFHASFWLNEFGHNFEFQIDDFKAVCIHLTEDKFHRCLRTA